MRNLDDGYLGRGGGAPDEATGRSPGKRTLTMGLAGTRAASDAPSVQRAPATAASLVPGEDPFGMHLPDAGAVQRLAADGVAGPAVELPHHQSIAASFGRHDVSGVAAHVGGPAADAAERMGAEAYATGHHVAFRAAPDLHTAAHEAAHVIQQRAGVQLAGGVGEAGDVYERGADAVADRVVRGESAEDLLDDMAGAGGTAATPPVQQRKGDFAALRKQRESSTVLVELEKQLRKATLLAQTEESVTLLLEGEHEPLALPREVVESEAFGLLDQAVPLDPMAEKRVGVNKQGNLVEAFTRLVDGKGEIKEEHLRLLMEAHDTSKSAAEFATAQRAYQVMLLDVFKLSPGDVMNVHRSAGFEYEFGRFVDPARPQITIEPELLRSHVTMAVSPPWSPLFGGRAACFRLETDSYNSLELVTPPFVILICGETGGHYAAMHQLYSTTTLGLGGLMQEARPEKKSESSSSDDGPSGSTDVIGVPISKQLPLLAKLLGTPEWMWEGETPTETFLFTFQSSKHGSKAYGQANLSMTPEEILTAAALMPSWNEEQDNLGLSSAKQAKSVPTTVSENIAQLMFSAAGFGKDIKLDGAIQLYARSASNLVGLPSIRYRQASGLRPEEGNLATSIKETLLLWVKDFPHAILGDALCGTEQAGPFIEALLATRDKAWELIATALEQNVQVLALESTKKVKAMASMDRVKPLLLQLPPNERLPAKRRYDEGTHPEQEPLQTGAKAAAMALDLALTEYRNMVDLVASTLKGAPYEKKHTKEEGTEQFGDGYGVRKDTYLDRAPGERRLRVAEVRDTSHLERMQKLL